MALGPADDLAAAGDHLAVVEHEDRHPTLSAELLDLGPVLGPEGSVQSFRLPPLTVLTS